MKALSMVILAVAGLLGCNGDVSESRNHRLPLGPSLTIPSPVQSLQPPTFENPIKDYTVGLVPPPVDNQASRAHQHHQHHHSPQPVAYQQTAHYAPRFIAQPVPSRVVLQQRLGSSHTPLAHHHALHSVQPQVYQPKTIVHQQYQQPSIHHHHHHQHHHPQYQPTSYTASTGPLLPQTIHHHSHHISVPTPVDYYTPITHPAVHQHSGTVHYASAPVHRVKTVAEHIHPTSHQSTVVPPSGVRIIQTYPSVSYAAAVPQHGSTLSLGNAKLEPELVYIISEILHHYQI